MLRTGTLPRLLIGTDLVAVDRLARLLRDHPALVRRVFTERERGYCTSRSRRPAEHLAARFAAKEAAMKALRTGAAGVDWTDIEVVNQLGGCPVLRLHGAAGRLARRAGVAQSEVSLSHTAGFAVAQVVLVCAPGPGAGAEHPARP
ncbi:holo-ACP synthase [Streptomyces sp. NPDC041068]|uniref:holo-ACP synthase n=1 Tax=Streptomyces sp. NPDC041068 TaxID=3155130 RepID=UPI003404B3B5